MQQKTDYVSFDFVLFGFILHAIGGIFFNSSKIICYTFCGLGLVIIFFNAFVNLKNIKPFKGFVLFLFLFYLIWSLFIVIRPFISSEIFNADGFSLISPFTWLSYTTPLIVFLGIKNLPLRSIFKFSYIYGIIGIVLLVLKYKEIFAVDQTFDSDEYQDYIGVAGIPIGFLSFSSFMVLCYAYVSSRYRLIAFSTLILALFISLYTARRSAVFMTTVIFIFTFYIYVFASRNSSSVLKILATIPLFILGFNIFNSYANSTFSFFFSRIDEDTRNGVVEFFYKSFQGETLDWIIGRGINGTYNCPIFDNPNRGMIETGYLHIILKGGVISLVLYCLLLGHSAYLGFFRTHNILTKAMAFNLTAHLIYLIPWGLPAFNFDFIIVWICILYCQSKEWRRCSDNAIKKHLNFQK